jgi:hypothetical protein
MDRASSPLTRREAILYPEYLMKRTTSDRLGATRRAHVRADVAFPVIPGRGGHVT